MFKEIYNTKEEKKYLIREFESLMYLIDDYGSFRNFLKKIVILKTGLLKHVMILLMNLKKHL